MEIKPLGQVGRPECVSEDDWRLHFDGVGHDTMHVTRLSETIYQVRVHRKPDWHYCTAEEIVPLLLAMQLNTPVDRKALSHVPVRKILPQKGLTMSQEDQDKLFKDL